MTIFHATDLHYLAPELTDHGALFESVVANGDGKVMDYIDEIADAFVDTVLTQRPDALILSGDLSFNGELRSHEVLSEKLRAVSEAGITVLVLPGNHDLYYPLAASYHGTECTMLGSITAEDFARIYAAYGFDQAVSRDSASLSYTCDLDDDLRILMLDTNTQAASGSAAQETLEWVKAQLEECVSEGKKVIAVSHQTLLTHNSMFRNGFVINNSDKLLQLYEQYGVKANLCGHMHMQHYAFSEKGSIPDIVTSAISITPIRYGVLSLTEDQTEYTSAAVDVSAWAKRQGKEDENLSDFADYAYRFFYDLTYRKAYAQLTEEETDLNEGQIHRLCTFAAEVNTGYFTGTLDAVDWDENAISQWEQLSSGVMYALYYRSIEPEKNMNYTSLTFEMG